MPRGPARRPRVLTVVYLSSRSDDTPLEMKQVHGPLDSAARTARLKIESYALSEFHAKTAPDGFLVENEDGFEVHRWYAPVPEKRAEPTHAPEPRTLRLAPRRSYL